MVDNRKSGFNNLLGWVQQTAKKIVDPDSDKRTHYLIDLIKYHLQTQNRSFSLTTTLHGVQYLPEELETAKAAVYRWLVDQYWSDGRITSKELQSIRWSRQALQIQVATAKAIDREFTNKHFVRAFDDLINLGDFTDAMAFRLREIAAAGGWTLPDIVRACCQTKANTFLQNRFRAMIQSGTFSQTAMQQLRVTAEQLGVNTMDLHRLVEADAQRFLQDKFRAVIQHGKLSQSTVQQLRVTAEQLGVNPSDLQRLIMADAQGLVEHVLADAKADSRLSSKESNNLNWLLANLPLSTSFCSYVQSEIAALQRLTEIADGRLPSLQPPSGIAVKSGEIVHFAGGGEWQWTKTLKYETRVEKHRGQIVITDNRLIFVSVSKSQSFNFGRVVFHRGLFDRLILQLQNKPVYTFFLEVSSEIPGAIFDSAIEMANQTKVAKTEGTPSRHIPRDVRQRVWQKYGGRCATCSATEYLEFDHIIPVAKGGSNSDNNIQLLCRKCNLTKSDKL